MTPIQKLKEENMLLKKGLMDTLKALNNVHYEADKALQKLNEIGAKYTGMNNMYDVDFSYMMHVGRYAWGERGKQIAGYYVRPVITKILDRVNGKS